MSEFEGRFKSLQGRAQASAFGTPADAPAPVIPTDPQVGDTVVLHGRPATVAELVVGTLSDRTTVPLLRLRFGDGTEHTVFQSEVRV